MSLNNSSEIKKTQNIRIKDLCPEEKRKIGELLKKLSNETEEKEKLQSMLQEDKKLYEEKIKTLETSLLQQSMMSTSNFNDLKLENCRQFSIERTKKKPEEKIIKNKLKEKNLAEKMNENNNTNNNYNSTAATLNDIRNLKVRFNSMFDKIKKANEINDSIIQKVEQEKNNVNNDKNLILDEKEEEPEKILPPSPTKQDSFYNDNYNDNEEYIYPNQKNNFDKSFLSNNDEFLNNLNSISAINNVNNNTLMNKNNDMDKNDNSYSRSKSKNKEKNMKIRNNKKSHYVNGINNIKVQQINKKFGSSYKDILSKAKLKSKELYDNENLNENKNINQNNNDEPNDMCNININNNRIQLAIIMKLIIKLIFKLIIMILKLIK